MRQSKVKTLLSFTLLFLLLFPLSVSSAPKIDPNIEEQGGVELEGERYDLEQYRAVTYIEESWNPFSLEKLDKMMNGIANMFFGMTKLVANIVDTGLRELYGLSIVNQFADKIGSASEELWDVLYENFAALLFVVAVLQVFFYYVAQRNGAKAGQATLKMMAVLIVAGVWFSQSGYLLKTLNNVSNEAQGAIMSAGAFLTTEDVNQENGLEASQALLRNAYFDLAVYDPYLAMNYGTTDEKAITEGDTNRITNLLRTPLTKDGYKEREKIVQKEVEELGNKSMALTSIYGKIAVSVFSFFFSLLLGIPLLLIAFVNFILQVLMLVIALFLPVSFVMAILPSFANSGWYTLGRLFGVAAMKIFVGIILLMTFMIVQITQEVVPSTSTEMYMLNAIITSVLLILMIKCRNKLIEFITAGKVSSVDMNAPGRAYQKAIKEPAQNASNRMKQGAQVAAAYAGTGGIGALSQMRNRSEQRTPQEGSAEQSKGAGNPNQGVVDLSGYREARSHRTAQTKDVPTGTQEKGSTQESQKKQNADQPLPMGVYNRQEVEQKRNPQKKTAGASNPPPKTPRRTNRTPQTGRLSNEERQAVRDRHNIQEGKPITQWEAQQQLREARDMPKQDQAKQEIAATRESALSNRTSNRTPQRTRDPQPKTTSTVSDATKKQRMITSKPSHVKPEQAKRQQKRTRQQTERERVRFHQASSQDREK